MLLNNDTITAISTPVGQAGIGIIRISGKDSASIAKKLFVPRSSSWPLESHRLYLGDLLDPSHGIPIDEVLLSFMKAPNTYTKEDVVEINSHSGVMLLSKVLQLVVEHGARLAMPGEFTLRAFLNGRIDLTQAEAVMDLINSRSEMGLRLATRQLKGSFGEKLEGIKNEAINLLAHIEVGIDFPDEDVDVVSGDESARILKEKILGPVESLIETHDMKRIWLDGLKTVLAGKVNVGKSSLLNRLLEEERAIVTPIAGTTRDVIEATIMIEGIPLRLMDTAGLRDVEDEVERIGVNLSAKKMEEADLLLAVIDQSIPLDKDDLRLLEQCMGRRALIILNKMDLPQCVPPESILERVAGCPVVSLSALTGEGLDGLKRAIVDSVKERDFDPGAAEAVTNLRHKEALVSALGYLSGALKSMKEGSPLEITALELRCGIDSIEEIVGPAASDAILEKIFSQFCLGK